MLLLVLVAVRLLLQTRARRPRRLTLKVWRLMSGRQAESAARTVVQMNGAVGRYNGRDCLIEARLLRIRALVGERHRRR